MTIIFFHHFLLYILFFPQVNIIFLPIGIKTCLRLCYHYTVWIICLELPHAIFFPCQDLNKKTLQLFSTTKKLYKNDIISCQGHLTTVWWVFENKTPLLSLTNGQFFQSWIFGLKFWHLILIWVTKNMYSSQSHGSTFGPCLWP